MDQRSDGVYSGFPCPDPDGFIDAGDEDFSIPDPPGLGGATDRLDRFFDHVVADENLGPAIEAIRGAAQTGRIGDGKIFVSQIDEAIRIRTGETGADAV